MAKMSQTEVVDLLNATKNNLSTLKDKNIISEYFKLLGAKIWIYNKATDNDILLPEIESLLEYYNYNCQFTESGIFVGTKKILGCTDNNGIEWMKGKNYTNFYGAEFYTTDTIGYNKVIRDFSELSESERMNISWTARKQIEHSSSNVDMLIDKIHIFNTITSGVEVSKKVMEEYHSKKNKEDWINIYITLAYSPNNPTINCNKQVIASSHLTSHLEDYIETTLYINNPPIGAESEDIVQHNYGDSTLHGSEYFVGEGQEYNYEQLYIKLMEYHQKHPLDIHPIFIYAKEYPEPVKKYLHELSDDFSFYEKMITSSTDSECFPMLTNALRQYRLVHPYEIHPMFFEINRFKGRMHSPDSTKYITEEHFKNLCLKK